MFAQDGTEGAADAGDRGPTRRRVLAGAALAGAAVLLPGGSAAFAGEAAAGPIEVVLEPDTLDVPERVPCGAVTFHVTTPAEEGRSLLLVRLAEGVGVDEYLALLAGTGAQDPQERAAAARAVSAAADNLGGAVVSAATGAGFTQVLTPGEYVLVNYGYASPGPPVVRTVRAVRGAVAGRPWAPAAIVHHDGAGGKEFAVAGSPPAGGALTVVNTTATPQEAMLVPVVPGTTEEDVRAYFEALRDGREPPVQPMLGRPVGMAPLGAGRRAVLHTEFAPGPHALFSFTVDHETGINHALQGMSRLVGLA
ncbi:hypothetical protein SAMN05421803_101384 [Nocardiopsis flavescens]|uniref:Uncharacterized protein n=1 Tax=Nocardiopsis flavescens TaxID=758803 RepID=A0A1M6BJT7_9ACTN|nr:hypothetical protein [Nocardiopsis flavescens]SHI48979.1 hypothetical protein SAMN05421803_101384 [Nocardiopsis flavescens]